MTDSESFCDNYTFNGLSLNGFVKNLTLIISPKRGTQTLKQPSSTELLNLLGSLLINSRT